MFFRLLAALMFTFAGALAGGAFSVRLWESRELCRSIGSLFSFAAVKIRFLGTDVYELVREAKKEQEFSRLCFIQLLPEFFVQGKDFHKEWHDALSVQELPREEQQLLEEFGNMLGRTDTEGQISGIAALNERLGRIEAERDKNYTQKGRMYRSVGVLLGVMTGILVI